MATFMDAAFLPGREEEWKRYEQHENDPDDPGYRRFLSRAAAPLIRRLQSGQKGLDFGCGPAPAMARLMEEAGHAVSLYDPFFFPDQTGLNRCYDFVTCTEVVEHFHRPREAFLQLDGLVRPGGYLAVTTCFQTDDEKFLHWHYRRDSTHVVFYRERTFHVLARQMGWRWEIPEKDVVLMQKF